jgi:SagB-type dehydrogenase family enzyme
VDEAVKNHAVYPQDTLFAEIEVLLDQEILTAEGTSSHERCQDYRRNWKWDVTAGAFHFTVLNNEFMPLEESRSEQLSKLEKASLPELFWPARSASTIPLPRPDASGDDTLLQLICARRTNRTSARQPVSIRQLADCLFAAFGITGFVKATSGYAPVSTAPSGGARNPFEAYVICNRCEGLARGIYHYCSISHELEQVNSFDETFQSSSLFASQEWIDDMAVVVVMLAVFDRSMWKYQDGNAYRVLLIEAGHRAQNFMLCATKHGLTSCPTAAIAHSKVAGLFGLPESLLLAPVYALTLDKACAYPDEFLPVDGMWPTRSVVAVQ